MDKRNLIYKLFSLAALLLIAGPIGISCIVEGFFFGDNPCILCWEERVAIILVSLTLMFMVRYGMKYRYLGILLFVAAYGLWAGYRQAAPHILGDIGQGFGPSILGVHTYVWVMLIFFCVILGLGLFLVFCGTDRLDDPEIWNKFDKSTMCVFLTIIVFNFIQAITQTGPPPFIGQGDPYRFSYNPKEIHWSMEHWPSSLSAFSLDKNYHIAPPDFSIVSPKISNEKEQALSLKEKINLPKEITGVATGISYNKDKNIFAVVTSNNYVYILNNNLSKILSYVEIDGKFSIDVNNLAGVSFDSPDTLIVTTDHKSYVRLQLDPAFKLSKQYWLFSKGTDGIKELQRKRFATVRSKYNYIGAIAWDNVKHEYVAISLPTKTRDNFVAMYFDGEDRQLNAEGKIKFDGKVKPTITGLDIVGNEAYLLDHNTKELLTMSTNTNTITKAYYLPEVVNPQGLTIKDNEAYVLNGMKGDNQVYVYNLMK